MRGPVAPSISSSMRERVRVRRPPASGRGRRLGDGAAVERLELEERPRAEEAVAADPLAADDALEEERPVALLDLAEGADGRERVAGELAVHRHDRVPARPGRRTRRRTGSSASGPPHGVRRGMVYARCGGLKSPREASGAAEAGRRKPPHPDFIGPLTGLRSPTGRARPVRRPAPGPVPGVGWHHPCRPGPARPMINDHRPQPR